MAIRLAPRRSELVSRPSVPDGRMELRGLGAGVREVDRPGGVGGRAERLAAVLLSVGSLIFVTAVVGIGTSAAWLVLPAGIAIAVGFVVLGWATE